MRRFRLMLFASMVLLLVVITGCVSKTPAASPVSSAPFQAPVGSIEILQVVGAPGQLRAWVKGNLPDGCARLVNPVVDVSGNLVVVILPAVHDSATQGCASGSTAYERAIDLGTAFVPGSYSVQINGVEAGFTLAGNETRPAAPSQVVAVTGENSASPATAGPGEAVSVPTKVAAAVVAMPTPTPTQASAQPASQPAAQPVLPTPVPTLPPSSVPAPLPTPTQPTPTQPAPAAGAAKTACENKAAFYGDVTVQDGTLFDPGQAFTKTWQVKNVGTCTWSGYLLVFKDGDPLSAAQPVKLDGAVAPGDIAQISVPMTAPQTPGNYYSDWLISGSDGSLFGTGAAGNGRLWVKMGVRSPAPVDGGTTCLYQTDASYEAQVLQLINGARAANGYKPLILDDGLSTAARIHSQDMGCNDFVDHYGSDGSTWFTRVTAQGVKYRSASENIYAGDPAFGGTPQGAFTWWMNSQVHRDNILNPKSTKIGIGYISAARSTYKGYYTLDFTAP